MSQSCLQAGNGRAENGFGKGADLVGRGHEFCNQKLHQDTLLAQHEVTPLRGPATSVRPRGPFPAPQGINGSGSRSGASHVFHSILRWRLCGHRGCPAFGTARFGLRYSRRRRPVCVYGSCCPEVIHMGAFGSYRL